MIIAVSGSMKHVAEMENIKNELELLGHTVYIPELSDAERAGEDLRVHKPRLIKNHVEKIKKSDAILVANYLKNNIQDYIGGNTFLEMGMAYALNKPIYLMNPIPDLAYTDEIHGLEPIILHGKLDEIRRP